MSYGCWVDVVNFSGEDVKLWVTLDDESNWQDPIKDNPKIAYDGVQIAAGTSGRAHVEIANGQTSAGFQIGFTMLGSQDAAVVHTDAWPVVNGGKRQGYIWATQGAANKRQYRVLEAQYDAQPNDPNGGYDWRHLSLVILPRRDPRRWMADLPDTWLLRDLTLPGTHDSGTSAITGPASNSIARARICQNLSLTQQLNIGVRFLDIRLNKDNGYEICHVTTDTALWMYKDCLTPVMEFLTENDTETVLMSVQSEHGTTDAFHDDLLAMIDASPFASKIILDDAPPDLGQCRGKIVILRRYWIDPKTNRNKAGDPRAGFGFHAFKTQSGKDIGWPENSDTFTDQGEWNYVLQQDGGQPVAIQDWFDLQTRMQPSKVAAIEKYLNAASSMLSGTMFLNFTSCMASGHSWDDPRNFAVGEDGINAAVMIYLQRHGAGRYGVIPMDFVGTPPEEALVDLLISTNFGR
jgi:1-phosphatidylinositol phosphodiesterase